MSAKRKSPAEGKAPPPHNEDIARGFDETADILEIEQENPFRVRAYRNAARTLRSLGEEVADKVARGENLADLPGVGEDLGGADRRDGLQRPLKQARRAAPDRAQARAGAHASARPRPQARRSPLPGPEAEAEDAARRCRGVSGRAGALSSRFRRQERAGAAGASERRSSAPDALQVGERRTLRRRRSGQSSRPEGGGEDRSRRQLSPQKGNRRRPRFRRRLALAGQGHRALHVDARSRRHSRRRLDSARASP